jgi:hypothetical protein
MLDCEHALGTDYERATNLAIDPFGSAGSEPGSIPIRAIVESGTA